MLAKTGLLTKRASKSLTSLKNPADLSTGVKALLSERRVCPQKPEFVRPLNKYSETKA
jgi:hypothetical protein